MSVRRDYKTPLTAKTRPLRRLLLAIGLPLVLVLTGLLAYIGYRPAQEPVATQAQSTERPADTQTADATGPVTPSRPQPKYDFYEVLPGREVMIPEEELNPRAQRSLKESPPPEREATPTAGTRKPEAASTARPKDSYVIQAGSFRSYAEADQRKASLALLLGVTARIESTSGPNNATWHRVRIGPLADISQAQALHRHLQDNNIPSIIVKR